MIINQLYLVYPRTRINLTDDIAHVLALYAERNRRPAEFIVIHEDDEIGEIDGIVIYHRKENFYKTKIGVGPC